MSQNVTKCRNLAMDKDGQWYCKSTHICHKGVCYSTIFETIIHANGRIIVSSM